MFFYRNQRVQTQPKISETFDTEARKSKNRLKIKSIRFSLDHQIDHTMLNKEQPKTKAQKGDEIRKSIDIRKMNFLARLPELNQESRQGNKQLKVDLKQVTLQHKKKDRLLSSILEILKPNHVRQMHLQQNLKPLRPRDYKIQTGSHEYVNQFFSELPQYSSTKHYRAPKVLQNQLMKYNNSHNIVRRKIFSEDKSRQRAATEKQDEDQKKLNVALEKVEMVTFSNKFSMFKKESYLGRDAKR